MAASLAMNLSPHELDGYGAVASPERRGRVSVREVVSSKNKTSSSRTRSLSAGSVRVRSHDIVQGVYDRMGVSLKRGQATTEAFGGAELLDGALTGQAAVGSTSPTAPARPDNNRAPVASSARGAAASEVSASQGGFLAEKFHERFREAVLRGRASEKDREASLRGRASEKDSETAVRGKAPEKGKEAAMRGRVSEKDREAAMRGRASEKESDNEKRSRSLSRGRLSKLWPPNRAESPPAEETASPTKRMTSSVGVRALTTAPWTPNINSKSTGSVPVTISTSFESDRSSSRAKDSSSKDEGKECGDDNLFPDFDAMAVAPPSVKDRISVYGTAAKPRTSRAVPRSADSQYTAPRSPNPQYAAQLSLRELPPKVDIYEANYRWKNDSLEKVAEEKKDSSSVPSLLQPTEAAGDAAVEWESPNRVCATGTAANVFLSAIQSPKTQQTFTKIQTNGSSGAPVAEISATGASGGNDNMSTAMSSVSAEEFSSPYRPLKETKKASWQERNRVAAYAHNPAAKNYQNSPAVSMEAIERMVDERVQAYVSDLETRVEDQLRRFMQRSDEKMMSRLSAMEQRINSLSSGLESMQSSGARHWI